MKILSENYSLKRKRKMVEQTEIYNDYVDNIMIKKPRKYRYITKKSREYKMKDIFKSFKSIKDIIALKDSKYIYDFIHFLLI